ncbi:MAG: efflux RND transporter periplasmic adaptor subunit [Pseudanabaenaceae cyanobacterium bins.68]|nr:efflux RND transporter periplasmic adaptor subunit [Pseudanabaenaceae cyanobacterium bins.68]
MTASLIEDSSDFIATLNSRQSVTLKPRVSGQISQILVSQGDQVENGTPLLTIDPSQQEATVQSNAAQVATARAEISSRKAAIQSAQASLESARALLNAREANRLERVSLVTLQRRDVQRDQELFNAGVISQRVLENRINTLAAAESALKSLDQEIIAQQATVREAQAGIAQAQADLNAARQRLQQSESNRLREQVGLQFHKVSAPFSGIVGNIPVKVGDFVSNTSQLLTLTQNEQLEIEIAVPVERASQLKAGLPVKILDNQDNTKTIGRGKILFVSPTVNPQSQSVLVKAAFDNSDKKLRQDQLVKVRLVWDSRPGLKIPITAISRQAGKTFVYTIGTTTTAGKTKTIAKQRLIELGKIVQNQQEVLSGLGSQEIIVISGIQFLNDGTEVTIQKGNP